MADNPLFGGGAAIPYPSYQPPTNPLTQAQSGIGVLQGLQGLQGQQIQQQQQQLELGQKRMNLVHDQLGAIAALPNPTIDDVKQAASTLYRAGIPQDQITQALSTVPQDSAGIKAWAQQHMAGIADFAQRMSLGSGNQISYDTAAGRQYGRVFPQFPGNPQFQGGTAMPVQPSPITRVPGPVIRDPTTGAPIQTQVTEDVANAVARGTHRYVPGPNGQIMLQPVAGKGAPAAPGGSPVPLPQAGTAVGMPTVPVGAGEAAGITAKTGADIGSNIERTSAAAPTRTGMLSNLEDDLQKFDTGPLAGYKLAAKRLGLDILKTTGATIPGVDMVSVEKSVAAHENFNKQATQLAQQQFASLGGTGTDQQLGSSFKANPNDALSPMGNKQIISLLKGNEDAIQTMNSEWQKWKAKHGSETGGQFMTWFNNNYSPRAFQFARMSPADQKDMVKNMSPAERANLDSTVKNALDRGWISPP